MRIKWQRIIGRGESFLVFLPLVPLVFPTEHLPFLLALLSLVLGESFPRVQLLLRGWSTPYDLLQGTMAELKLLLGRDELPPASMQGLDDLHWGVGERRELYIVNIDHGLVLCEWICTCKQAYSLFVLIWDQKCHSKVSCMSLRQSMACCSTGSATSHKESPSVSA